MVRTSIPELKKCHITFCYRPYIYISARFMDKRLQLQLNANRKISGVLRGYDAFMNIVLDETFEEISATERRPVGMVVFISDVSVPFFIYLVFRLYVEIVS